MIYSFRICEAGEISQLTVNTASANVTKVILVSIYAVIYGRAASVMITEVVAVRIRVNAKLLQSYVSELYKFTLCKSIPAVQ